MEMEQLPQADDGRKVNQAFVLQFRRQFFLCFRLRFARDRSEESARCVLKRLHRTVRKRVTFLAPKFPPDVARHVLGIKFHSIENDPRRFHHIVPNAVARHPRNSVFSHRKAILSARAPPASEPRSFWRRPRITRIKRIGDKKQTMARRPSAPQAGCLCYEWSAPTVVIPRWKSVPNRLAGSSY